MHGVSQGYGRVAYRHTVHVTAILALTVSLAACQTDGGPPALTLEEAKKVTATFEESSFTPPPRTIKDITAILDKEKRADPAAAAKALAEALP